MVQTPNLELLPHTVGHLQALLESEETYERQFGLKLAPGIREFLISDATQPEFLENIRRSQATTWDPWHQGFVVRHRLDQIIMGLGGYKGPPDDQGMVEIAYGTAPTYQGRGYATETAQALTDYAFECDQVTMVRAHTLPEINASNRVLTKCGFERKEDYHDPEDGLVWRWERPKHGGCF